MADDLEYPNDRLSIRCTAVLAGARTDRPPTRLTYSLLSVCGITDRLATALTDNLLGAFAIINQTQTTASTDHFLGVFGFTDHLEKRVQRLYAEPTNDPNHPPPVTSRT